MPRVVFFDPSVPISQDYLYSVVGGLYNGKWIFVFNIRRNSYELPAGRIEPPETPLEAAGREFAEETGATDFTLSTVSAYLVEEQDHKGYGMLFLARVHRLGLIVDREEIGKIKLCDTSPESLSFPDIQGALFDKLREYALNERWL